MTKINKTVGIITIHRIHNYGSVLQAFALCRIIDSLGYQSELIDYIFPNSFQKTSSLASLPVSVSKTTAKQKLIKLLYSFELFKQHKLTDNFLKGRVRFSGETYYSPNEINSHSPNYDIYMTGSDQVWNPRYTRGDMTFLLDFVIGNKKCVSYAASYGTTDIPDELKKLYSKNLSKYSYIGVREKSGATLTKQLCGKTASVVLDPTLLLNAKEWNKEIPTSRRIKEKYIFCYFLNYSFDAFPYADHFAEHIKKITGYKLVYGTRPPQYFFNPGAHYMVGLGPIEFMQMIRDAEIVLTTSFHGTAFAVNFGRPVYSIIESRDSGDSRQTSLLDSLGLNDRIVEKWASFPSKEHLLYDVFPSMDKLNQMRMKSVSFIKKILED